MISLFKRLQQENRYMWQRLRLGEEGDELADPVPHCNMRRRAAAEEAEAWLVLASARRAAVPCAPSADDSAKN